LIAGEDPGGFDFDAWHARIEEPAYGDPEFEQLGLRNRLAGSPALRSAVPLRLAVAAALLRGRRRFATDEAAREHALAWAATHALSEPGDLEPLARAALGEEAVQEVLKWRRRLPRRTRVAGAGELDRARDGGRGALVVALRLGPSYALPELLARRIGRVYLPVARDPHAQEAVRYRRSHVKVAWRARAEAAGVRFVVPRRSGDVAELLRRGMVVFRFMNGDRTRAVDLLDRRFHLAFDPSELAFTADVPVFPALIVRRGRRLHAELLPRLEPRRDWTPDELHRRIAAALDPALRAHLPQLYPNRLLTAEEAVARAARARRKHARRAAQARAAATTPGE
jgi:hypothetical protein